MKNKRILVFIAHVDKWGAERSVISMCVGLNRSGYSTLVIIPRRGPIEELLTNNGIDYMVYKYPLSIGSLFDRKISFIRALARMRHIVPDYIRMHKQLFSLKHILENKGIIPVAVYSASLTIDFGARFALLCKVKHIQHIRENLNAFNYSLKYGYKNGMKIISKASSLIICTCNAVKRCYENDLPNDKMFVVYNGVTSKNDLLVKHTSNKLQMIQTARLMSDKNIIESIKAIEIVLATGRTELHLDIYGVGEQEEMLKKYVQEHQLCECITFKGFCEQIDYSNYNVGLMTSLYEAFARSVLEYMNNELVVLASNSGGNVEQIRNEDTGLLYKVNHPEDLAYAICKLYDDVNLRERLAIAGREYFLSHFTQDAFVKNITKLIVSHINE